jgi:uncharacterized protein (TIGR03435 family)
MFMIGKMLIVGFVGTGMAMGQSVVAPTAATPAKAWTFDVVSIKRNMSAPGTQKQSYGPTPDGYRMRNLFIEMPILTAYVPQSGGRASYIPARVVGLPDWAMNDAYDIDAKVAEADLADWQNPAKQPVMLRAMLQAMLQDRLKMVVHRGTKEVPVYSLVAGTNGPKLKETNPNEPHPGGFPIPGGGVVVSNVQNGEIFTNWYGVSMATVASWGVLGNAERPVQDKTGLTGRYDIAFEPRQLRTCAPNCGPQDAAPEEDAGSSVFEFVQELGLKLVPATGPVETLVIDHIERPSPN